MAHFGGGGGGRTRMGTKVYLNVYDLASANDYLYPLGLGLHHSGVEVLGSEYSFASGAGIFDGTPKEAPGARFREQVYMGAYDGGMVELRRALDDLRGQEFGPGDYHLIRKNCNAFANALCWILLRKTIPPYVNRLADIGVCCSCLLPKKLLEESPVGDPNRTASGEFNNNYRSISAAKPATSAFSGTGSRLGGSGGSQEQSSGWQWTNSAKKSEDLTDRREKVRKAALARLEKMQSDPQQQHAQSKQAID